MNMYLEFRLTRASNFFLTGQSTVKTSMSVLRIMGEVIVTTRAQTLPGHSAVRVPWAST